MTATSGNGRFLGMRLIPMLVSAGLVSVALAAAGGPPERPRLDAPVRSPENHVYQFMATRSFAFSGGKTRQATAYLWIPPSRAKIRGVLVACRNVTEHWLTGHPAIRDACEKESLALLWSCPSFYPGMDATDDNRELVAFLREILGELAATSGYAELARAPWLPIGESAHLQMVKRLVEAAPEQCIAAIQIKNGRMDIGAVTSVPVLTTIGTCYEWDQEKADLLAQWKTPKDDAAHQRRRESNPDWPGSLLVEGGSGHFECTEPMAAYIASYITAAMRARLPDGESIPRPVDLRAGWIAGLGLPGGVDLPPKPFKDATPEERALPWFFTRELAEQARAMARINWDAATQVPVFADATGKPLPFGYRSIFSPLPFEPENDGITFPLHAGFLDALPPGFVNAGTRLGHSTAGAPRVDWICGPVAPAGGNRFRVALDRSWPDSPAFLCVWHPGDGNFRHSVQPGEIKLSPNTSGKPQSIDFTLPAELPAGTTVLPLQATSDQGLPVRFFVRAGPGMVVDGKLLLTPIPPRARFPVALTVVAWQWGRAGDEPIQTAPTVERTLMLTAPRQLESPLPTPNSSR